MADEKKSDTKPTTYVAVHRIFHSVEETYYEPGSVVPLNHLADKDIEKLLAIGAVRVTNLDLKYNELETLRGIKVETAKALHGIGITSLSALANADAREVESKIGVVTVRQVLEWQAAARKVLAETSVTA